MVSRLLAVVLFVVPFGAFGNGFDSANVNPRDLAMANATVAAQEGSGAAYANPAALARVEGLNFDVAGAVIDLRTHWADSSGTLGGPTSTTAHPTTPPAASIAYGLRLADRPVGVGLAFAIPAGGNMYWPADWAGRYRAITTDRKMLGFYGAAGVEVVRGLRVGGGVGYLRITEHVQQAFSPAAPNLLADLTTSGGGFTYDLSAEYSPFEDVPLTVGVDYKHQVRATLAGDVTFSNVPPPLSSMLVDQQARHAVAIPNVLNAGVSYRPIRSLQFAFGYTFNRYVVYRADTFTFQTLTAITVPRDYGNGYTFRLGAEWVTTPRVTLRAGVLRDHSGMPTVEGAGDALVSPTYSPTLPDSHAWAFSGGAAWRATPALSVQGAVFFKLADRVSSGATQVVAGGPFPGTYDTTAWIYSLGLVWRPAA